MPTRWRVRASCYERIIENYSSLFQVWKHCLTKKLEPDIKARILGCEYQMKAFDFFYGLHLSHRIFSHTEFFFVNDMLLSVLKRVKQHQISQKQSKIATGSCTTRQLIYPLLPSENVLINLHSRYMHQWKPCYLRLLKERKPNKKSTILKLIITKT